MQVPDRVHPSGQVHLTLEMQRLAACTRLVTVLLCAAVFLRTPTEGDASAATALLVYALWATARLWHTTSPGIRPAVAAVDSLIDVLWVVLMLRATTGIESMLLLALAQPFVIGTLVLGALPMLLLGACAAAAVLVDVSTWPWTMHARETTLAQAVVVLAVAGIVLTRPMAVLQRRRALVRPLTAEIDPHRGLGATMAQIARALRQMSGAQVLALTLPTAGGGRTGFSTEAEGDFPASPATHRQIERLLADLPEQVLSDRPCTLCARLIRRAAGRADPDARVRRLLADLGRLLQVRHVTVVPLQRDGRCRGHTLLGWGTSVTCGGDPSGELIDAAPELLRLIDTASLIDQLQDEAAGHERARIGRDLHDSAIQPYLGLKFAVESVAQRASADNPLHADLAQLVELVNGEIGHLREVISVLRTGDASGDNALVSALRRLVRRHAQLFGVEVLLDCPATLTTSRALASAVFHMVSEAMNNARKHTVARRIWISLERHDHTIHVRIRDDAGTRLGRRMPGFRPSALSERVAELGGTLDIGHAGLDTELHFKIPG